MQKISTKVLLCSLTLEKKHRNRSSEGSDDVTQDGGCVQRTEGRGLPAPLLPLAWLMS